MRKIVRIDEARCDGCGLCAAACAEGAIEISGGKARLVSEVYCDGLGACLGECTRGAITVEERDAAGFDAQATARHLSALSSSAARRKNHGPVAAPPTAAPARNEGLPELSHWPVQLALVSPEAPWLRGASLLLAADCVPFAVADFHHRFLAGRRALVACPKLDDVAAYLEKLTAIFRQNDVREVQVASMEVPCCSRLARIAAEALERAGRDIPLTLHRIPVPRGKR